MLCGTCILAVFLLFTNVNCSNKEDGSVSTPASVDAGHPDMEKDAYAELYEAAKNGSVSSIQTLIKQGLLVNKPDNSSYTALHYAAMHGRIKAVVEILKSGANINAVNEENKTPLMYAAENDHLYVLLELIKNGADVNAKNKDGIPALMLGLRNGHDAIAEELLFNGADPNFKEPETQITPLHLASEYGYQLLVELLLSKGADVNAIGSNGWTTLHYASRKGMLKVVKLLLPLISDINARTKEDNYTSLHLAARYGKTSIVKELLGHGADINALTIHNETALHLAVLIPVPYTVKVLLYNESTSSPTSANVFQKNQAGLTPLHYAANTEILEMAQDLIESVANSTKPTNPDSLLHVDTEPQQLNSLQSVKDYVNTKDNKGRTAIHYAASRGNLPMIKFLCSYGADKNVMDIENSTILTVAARQGQMKLLEELMFNNEDDANELVSEDSEWSPFHKSSWKVMALTEMGRRNIALALVVQFCECFKSYDVSFKLDEETVNGIQEKFLSILSIDLREKLENKGYEGTDLDSDYLSESEKEEVQNAIKEAFHPTLGKIVDAVQQQQGVSAEKDTSGEEKGKVEEKVLNEVPPNQKESGEKHAENEL